MKELEISPSFLIRQVHYWGRAFRDSILGPQRANLIDPCRSATQRRPAYLTPLRLQRVAPLEFIQTAVTRVLPDGGEVLNPDERITVQQALKSHHRRKGLAARRRTSPHVRSLMRRSR